MNKTQQRQATNANLMQKITIEPVMNQSHENIL